jgi:hypothetical protein
VISTGFIMTGGFQSAYILIQQIFLVMGQPSNDPRIGGLFWKLNIINGLDYDHLNTFMRYFVSFFSGFILGQVLIIVNFQHVTMKLE